MVIEIHKSSLRNGFTLIELSIVLVIIGLLVGGVLVGKDLIRASEIRSIIKDVDNYKSAYHAFKLKYNCIAGDCPNATDFFGAQDPDPTTCQSTASTGTLTCNGNGDGRVSIYFMTTTYYESFRFWQHLAIAGLINGKYTGVAGGAGSYDHIIGVNCPKAAIDGTGFSFLYVNLPLGNPTNYAMNYGHTFVLGKRIVNNNTGNPMFTPSEAYAFDQKIDDGKPATGSVIAKTDGYPFGSANSCTTSSSNTDYTGVYATSHNVVSCAFKIKTGEY